MLALKEVQTVGRLMCPLGLITQHIQRSAKC
jgi:hypothetical protein